MINMHPDNKPTWQFSGNERKDMAVTKAWAERLLASPDTWLILDTETTDLEGFILELSILRPNGTAAFDSLLNANWPIGEQAFKVHGIKQSDVEHAKTFAQIEPRLQQVMWGKTIVVYNVMFDYMRLNAELVRMYEAQGSSRKDALQFAHDWLSKCTWDCAMEHYAVYVGNYIQGDGRYKRQRLNGGHRALDDCKAVLQRIQTMAEANLDDYEDSDCEPLE